MIKPEWKLAPPWANYLAQDRNGTWFWFENEPKLPTEPDAADVWRPNYGKCEQAIHWTETTERRP